VYDWQGFQFFTIKVIAETANYLNLMLTTTKKSYVTVDAANIILSFSAKRELAKKNTRSAFKKRR
jgi:hypothetical protein